MNKNQIEELKKLLFHDRLTQSGKQKLIDYMENLESKLNKVTEECRKQMKEYEDSILEIFPQRILVIIEGEKK